MVISLLQSPTNPHTYSYHHHSFHNNMNGI